MNSKLVAIFALLLSSAVVADGFDDIFGGYIVKPNTGSGKIVFVNKQSVFADETISEVAKSIEDAYSFRVSVATARPVDDCVAVIIESVKDAPRILIAPEDGYARMNVDRLGNANTTTAKDRFKKELLRTFAFLVGSSSQYSGNLLNVVMSNQALDEIKDLGLPVDLDERMKNYLKGFGVTRYTKVYYQDACEAGWAPHPTNDLQRAIWEKVHAPPTKPLKITYDKDGQKPVVK